MTWILNSLILTLYFVLYGLIHSWMANLSVKKWIQETVGFAVMRGYRLAYNIFALVTLMPFFVLQATLPNPLLYSAPSPWLWLMVGGQIVAIIGISITLLQTGLLHFLGLSQLFTENPPENTPLSGKGLYKFVRHPLYFLCMVFLWLSPIMTLNQLIGYILFSFYFYIGSKYEERKLVAEFGETYRDYQRHVPRLFPFKTIIVMKSKK